MEYKILDIQIAERIATVVINRPKALNALNTETMNELHHFFITALPTNDAIQGVIITGAGEKAFIAGADITEFSDLKDDEGMLLSKKGHDIFDAIEQSKKVVIAAVNGFSLGGGNELAMACHIRIASDNARFGQPEANLGLVPGYGGTQRLVQLIGKGRALELMLTTNMIGAEEAQRLGLVSKVTTPEELMAACKKMMNKILSKGPIAIAETIRLVNAFFDKNLNGFEEEYRSFGTLMNTDDVKEGSQAFVEKRPANFTGK